VFGDSQCGYNGGILNDLLGDAILPAAEFEELALAEQRNQTRQRDSRYSHEQRVPIRLRMSSFIVALSPLARAESSDAIGQGALG
jgi:hypothetical protein